MMPYSKYDLALDIVRDVFKDKVDLAGQPYIGHLKRVAENVKKYRCFAAVQELDVYYIVGLLHDLLEDCPEWDVRHVGAIFKDPAICEALKLLTKPGQADTYDEYIERISKNDVARAVKLADLEDNMDLTRLNSGLTEKDIERIKKYHRAYCFLKQVFNKQ
jgi:(p)ppGpp synthase/HD superfamily hydrolase